MTTEPYFRVTAGAAGPDGAPAPRVGRLITAHGVIDTPAFVPVATQATVKALAPADLRGLGAQVLIANTYHLALRPGVDLIEDAGGLHDFMRWDGPIATDSGGFQITSLAHRLRVSDEAVTFRSHVDGQPLHLSPESAVQLQERLGADMLMCLDQPLAFGADRERVQRAMERTHRWAERSARAHTGRAGLLYGIVQGGTDADLRAESARVVGAIRGLQGIAVGGLSLGEPKDTMWEMVDITLPLVLSNRPRHLLGVGSPEDLIEGVARGIDTFDCALPTRVARNGGLYTCQGRVDITNARFRRQWGAVMDGCDCSTCAEFSAAYLHHLFKAKELLAYRLASVHNLRFVHRLLEEARIAIANGKFESLRRDFHAAYVPSDADSRDEQRGKWQQRQLSAARENLPADWHPDEGID